MEEQQDAHVKAYYAHIKYLLGKSGIDTSRIKITKQAD